MLRNPGFLVLLALVVAGSGAAQTPQPFPRPGAVPPPPPPVSAAPEPAPALPPAVVDPNAPTEAQLGFPIYPAARFITSYDAGRGQRYYLFGAMAPFTDLVAYYRSVLDEGGDQVFDQPLTHMFEIGRFDDDTMVFPPGVTIKDWTWGGSAGYPSPEPAGQPVRYPTVIMIVPAPPAAPQG